MPHRDPSPTDPCVCHQPDVARPHDAKAATGDCDWPPFLTGSRRLTMLMLVLLTIRLAGCASVGRPMPQPTYRPAPTPGSPAVTPTPANPGTTVPAIPDPNAYTPEMVRPQLQVDLGNPEFTPGTPDATQARRPVAPAEPADPATTTAPRENVATNRSGTPGSLRRAGNSSKVWKNTFRSAGNRPLQTRRIGNGPTRILVTSSLHGNQSESVTVVDQLLAAFLRRPDLLNGYSVLLVRSPNPDGLAEGTMTNLRGVDLNRNFPSDRFTARPTTLTGPAPASEVETQALIRLMQDFRPQRVIHLRSGLGSRPMVVGNAVSTPRLSEIGVDDRIETGTFSGDLKAGSLEEYVTRKLKSEVLVVHLPRQLDEKGLEDATSAAMAATLGRLPATDAHIVRMQPPVPEQADRRDSTAPASTDGNKGFVELLPPPPEVSSTPTGHRPGKADRAGNGDARYYELPPPPQS
ncbi:M14 family zinc carboxypeptidase [Maioricimonas sp. JC845]|uniref:M14 family zinc carboxypeptidase n=1 Tax=Maioricimonas sp. JC845 TaxID=3232138 RepID=UPI00345B11CF